MRKKLAKLKPKRSGKHGRPANLAPSMKVAAVRLKTTMDVLRAMRAAGCDAFRPGGPVHIPDAKRWIAEHGAEIAVESAKLGLRDQKLGEEIRKLKLANDQRSGRLVPRVDVDAHLARFHGWQLSVLRQRLENEYPAKGAGLDHASLRKLGKDLVDAICADHETELMGWLK